MTALAPIDAELADELARFYADPLGFVLFAYPWERRELRLVRLPEPWCYVYDTEYGPDGWACEVLERIGEEVRARRFDGSRAVEPIRVAIASGHGIGKVQSNELVVPTPDGPRRWGDVEVGDHLFGADGRPVRVLAKYPHRNWPFYRVTFDDGSSTLAGPEHRWAVRGRQERRKGLGGWRVMTTQELVEAGVRRPNGVTMARQWEIPTQGPAQFASRPVSLDPYLVGVWLGDGSRGTPRYCKPVPVIADKLASRGLSLSVSSDGRTYYVRGVADAFKRSVFRLGSHERYVPDEYKYNTIEVRREVLAGLLDTDGEVCTSGAVGFCSTSRRLVEDVVWLARSLGYKAMIQPTPKQGRFAGEDKRLAWRCTLQPTENLFTHPVKRAAFRPATQERYRKRWIDSIEFSHYGDGHCVTVDAPDSLYLTNDFIVTHNSALTAWLVDWIMSTRPFAQGTVTANTAPQLETKTWAQIAKWTRLCITSHWFDLRTGRGSMKMVHKAAPEAWFCSAQTCREENSEAFAGQHAANSTSFYVFDEASAVPDAIWEVAEGGLTDGEPMWFVFGNPTRNTGRFRECFGRQRHRWLTWQIDSRDVQITNKAQLRQWVEDYGEDSDFVRVRVRGVFPRASSLQFIDNETVRAAMKREARCNLDDPLIMAVDVARGGDDNCVVRFRRGLDARTIPPVRLPGAEARDSMRLVSLIVELIERHKPDAVFIDETGVGGPVLDRVRQLGHNAIGVQFGAAPPDRRYANMRAYMWARMREWLMAGGAIDDDPVLEQDLTAPEYAHDSKDRLVLEAKEKMKARGLASPDDGDALAMTFAMPVAPRSPRTAEPAAERRRYDPYRRV